MKIYTCTGDKGTTCLVTGERVPKYDERVEAYGTVDELMANIALLHDSMDEDEVFRPLRKDLMRVNYQLMTISAIFAGTDAQTAESALDFLEGRIDEISATLKPVTKFTLPGGHELISRSHLCRTVCRRAERAACRTNAKYSLDSASLRYLNRLSDYLYTLGRKLTEILNIKETYWVLEK